MEIQEEIPGYVPVSEPKKWFHNGWFSRGFLVIAGLFFLLPFINIKCSGTQLATVKGIDLITGTEIKPETNKENVSEEDSTSSNSEESVADPASLFMPGPMVPENGDDKRIAPNAVGIAAFSSLILGLLFSFFPKRIPVIISGGFCLLGALCLFLIQIQINKEVEAKMGNMGSFLSFSPITFEFTPYYWTCVFLMTLAAVFSFLRSSILAKK